MSLELEPTTDILAELARSKSSQIIIGFAAETENVLENARKKLMSKSLDAIVVNDVSHEGVGFDSDRNAVTIITHSEVIEVPETTKWKLPARARPGNSTAKSATGQVATTSHVGTAALSRRPSKSSAMMDLQPKQEIALMPTNPGPTTQTRPGRPHPLLQRTRHL